MDWEYALSKLREFFTRMLPPAAVEEAGFLLARLEEAHEDALEDAEEE